jgi:glutamyl-tRNA reductase
VKWGEIKTIKDFHKYLTTKRKEEGYDFTSFSIGEFRSKKKKGTIEELNQFLNIRITKEDKELIQWLKKEEKINISREIREFIRFLNEEKFQEIQKKRLEEKKEELEFIKLEVKRILKKLSILVFEEFNEKNIEERYQLKYELNLFKLRQLKIEEYLKN